MGLLGKVNLEYFKKGNGMFRVALSKKNGEIVSENFETKDEAELWILEMEETQQLKTAMIANSENKKDRSIIKFGENNENN